MCDYCSYYFVQFTVFVVILRTTVSSNICFYVTLQLDIYCKKKPSPVSDLFETPTGTALSYIFKKIFYVMNTNCQVVTGVNCYSNN